MKFGKQLELGIYEPWREYVRDAWITSICSFCTHPVSFVILSLCFSCLSKYLQYSRLKRIIKRKRFLADKNAELSQSARQPSSSKLVQMTSMGGKGSDERTPLNAGGGSIESYEKSSDPRKQIDENSDFFPFVVKEMEKINKFFVGKLAELRINLELITSKRNNSYVSHHTSGETDLLMLRDIYVELAALRSYCDLNQTGLCHF